MDKLYSRKHLLLALKQAGLPHTYITLLSYERKGIVPKPKLAIGFGNGKWRFYTREDIKSTVRLVRKYRNEKQGVAN